MSVLCPPSSVLRPVTFEELWARDYEPLLAGRRRRTDEHRTEAMIEAVLPLCGEPVRQITPHDLFTLDAIGNPFICGSEDGTVNFVDCAGLIWEIHERNTHTSGLFNLRRRAQAVQRLALIPIETLATAIESYLARMRLEDRDSLNANHPEPVEGHFKPEPKTHFLVPLLVEVTAELGPTDPVSGELMSHIPLPRLIQYQRAFHENKGTAKTYTEVDAMRVKCLQRVNEINHAARKSESSAVLQPAASGSDPSSVLRPPSSA